MQDWGGNRPRGKQIDQRRPSGAAESLMWACKHQVVELQRRGTQRDGRAVVHAAAACPAEAAAAAKANSNSSSWCSSSSGYWQSCRRHNQLWHLPQS